MPVDAGRGLTSRKGRKVAGIIVEYGPGSDWNAAIPGQVPSPNAAKVAVRRLTG